MIPSNQERIEKKKPAAETTQHYRRATQTTWATRATQTTLATRGYSYYTGYTGYTGCSRAISHSGLQIAS